MTSVAFERLADGLQHPEGLCWDPLTERIYCGGEGGQIYAVTLAGEVTEVANTGGSVLGTAVDGRGWIYACDWMRSEVVLIDPLTGQVETYSKGSPGIALKEPNWPTFDEEGNLYVTASEGPAVFRVAPRGETQVWSEAVGGYPNGTALAPDGTALYVAQSHPEDSEGGRVWRIPILPDGSAGEPQIVVELPRTVPDGLAFDERGRLYVAHYRPDRIDRVSPDGSVETLVDDWEARTLDAPTNLAFAGAALDRAVVACVGSDFLAIGDVGAHGLPLRRPVLA